MSIPFDEIRNADGWSVCEALGLERYKGERHKFSCPACGCSRSVHAYKDGIHCHQCGLGTIDLAMAALDGDHIEASKVLADRLGIVYDDDPAGYVAPRPLKLERPTKRDAHDVTVLRALYAEHDLGDGAIAYLDSRGVSADVARAAGLVSVEDGARWDDLLSGYTSASLERAGLERVDDGKRKRVAWSWPALLLPFFGPKGALEGLRFAPFGAARRRDPRKYFSLYGGNPAHPFGSEAIEQARDRQAVLYVCEGELNALSLRQLGYHAISAAGSNSWRADWSARLDGVDVAVVADGDDAGQSFAARLYGDLCREHGMVTTGERFRVVDCPPGRDANDLLGLGLLDGLLVWKGWDRLVSRAQLWVEGWPEAERAAHAERVAIMVEAGRMSEDEARVLAAYRLLVESEQMMTFLPASSVDSSPRL